MSSQERAIDARLDTINKETEKKKTKELSSFAGVDCNFYLVIQKYVEKRGHKVVNFEVIKTGCLQGFSYKESFGKDIKNISMIVTELLLSKFDTDLYNTLKEFSLEDEIGYPFLSLNISVVYANEYGAIAGLNFINCRLKEINMQSTISDLATERNYDLHVEAVNELDETSIRWLFESDIKSNRGY